MSIAIALYQITIAVIVISAGRVGGKVGCVIAAILASIWTLTHVFMPWLMILQFGTILVALVIGLVFAKPLSINDEESAQDDTDKLAGGEVEEFVWQTQKDVEYQYRLDRKKAKNPKLPMASYVNKEEKGISQVSKTAEVVCPHCGQTTSFNRKSVGRWVGTATGGGVGYFIGSGLGIAGGILSAPIAIPATLVGLGIGAFIGNRAGKSIDNKKATCINCGKSVVL